MRFRIFSILLLLVLTACSSRKPQVVLETRHIAVESDSLMRILSRIVMSQTNQKESEHLSFIESATYTLNESGDTVKTIIERERETKSESNVQTAFFMAYMDSVYRANSRTDSIYIEVPVPCEVIKEVNKLNWWQKILNWSGGIAWVVFAVWIYTALKKRR